MPRDWMKLETHKDTIIDPITPEVIKETVAPLVEVGEAFVVLSQHIEVIDSVGVHMYVQAAGTVSEGFVVEYRDGGPGDHYRGDRLVSAEELIALLGSYPSKGWNEGVAWHRVVIGNSPSA